MLDRQVWRTPLPQIEAAITRRTGKTISFVLDYATKSASPKLMRWGYTWEQYLCDKDRIELARGLNEHSALDERFLRRESKEIDARWDRTRNYLLRCVYSRLLTSQSYAEEIKAA